MDQSLSPARIAGSLTTNFCIYGILVAIPLTITISFGFILAFMKLPSMWVGLATALISAWWVGVICSSGYVAAKSFRVSSLLGVLSAFSVILIGLAAGAAFFSIAGESRLVEDQSFLQGFWQNFKLLVSLVMPWAALPAVLLGWTCGHRIHAQLFPTE